MAAVDLLDRAKDDLLASQQRLLGEIDEWALYGAINDLSAAVAALIEHLENP